MTTHHAEALWYVVQTKPRQEALADRVLRMLGVETLYPQVSSRKALFTSYLFARFPAETHLRRIKFAQGVKTVVGFGMEPTPIDEGFLDAIRDRIRDGFVILDSPALTPGDRVQIQKGPLEGVEGIFDFRLKDSDRVVILLDFLTSQGRLVIPVTNLRKAS